MSACDDVAGSDRETRMQRYGRHGPIVAASVVLSAACLSGCTGRENLPPVFGAVFGLAGAPATPFVEGRIPEPVVGSGSRLVGAAAANPGACIWQNEAGRRFRATCPEGSDGLKPRL